MQLRYALSLTLYFFVFPFCLHANPYIHRFAQAISTLKAHQQPKAQQELLKMVRIQRPSDVATLYATINALGLGTTYPILNAHAATIKNALETFSEVENIATKIHETLSAIDNPHFMKGHVYELEKALAIHEHNDDEKIESFSAPLHCPQGTYFRILDIITNRRFIECKNINWDHVPVNSGRKIASYLKQQFLDEQKLVAAENERTNDDKRFVVASKQPIPSNWQACFKEHGIEYESD